MTELLRIANDTSLPEPWPRVHAFNVLRLAFNDKNLATDSSGFFAEGAASPSYPHFDLKCSCTCPNQPGSSGIRTTKYSGALTASLLLIWRSASVSCCYVLV